jgi:uncharacterized protein YcgL (UPF0745 family)
MKKIASQLDSIANSLQQIGKVKLAYILDTISDRLEKKANAQGIKNTLEQLLYLLRQMPPHDEKIPHIREEVFHFFKEEERAKDSYIGKTLGNVDATNLFSLISLFKSVSSMDPGLLTEADSKFLEKILSMAKG